MLTEHALLPVKPGFGEDFRAAFERSGPLASSTTGFLRLQLERSIETPHHFLPRVCRETAQAHTEGFRGSANCESWKNLLHHFYDPFAPVGHFESLEPAAAAR